MLSSYIHRITSVEINQALREPEDSGTIEVLITIDGMDRPLEYTLWFSGKSKDMLVEHHLPETTGMIRRENLMRITCEGDEDE